MEEYIKKWRSFVEKVKKIKNKEIIVGIVILAIVVVIYSNIAGVSGTKEQATADSAEVGAVTITASMEARLGAILSSVEGAGDVKVMVSYCTTPEIVTAVATESYTTENNGSTVTTETKTPVILNKNGDDEIVVLQELMPKVKGVIVVADGGGDIAVKMALISAIQTVLEVNANQIAIFAGKIQ